MKKSGLILARGIASLLAIWGTTVSASNFTVSTATTSAKTLDSGDTGTVTSSGSIILSNSSNVITINSNATIINSGTLRQNGSGRVARSQADGTTLQITNNSTGIIEAINGDTFKISNLKLTVDNYGQILNTGNQAFDLADVTTVSRGAQINNYAGGLIRSTSGDAIKTGAGAVITNAGTILSIPDIVSGNADSDYGINTDTNSGIIVNNTGSIKGRHGITGGVTSGSYTLTVNNSGSGVIEAANGSGINIDGVFTTAGANVTNGVGATIKGGVDNVSTAGDGDGVDVDGVLTLDNSGDILGLGAKGNGSDTLPNNAEAVAAGGGTIINRATGRIIGSTLAADAPNGLTSRAGNGILIDNSSNGNAIAAATITNSGLIQGKTGVAIKILGTFADQITNNAGGTIRGAGTGAAIQTGDGGDTLTNAGTIIGDNGLAVDLEAGNDTLNVTGGAAGITGDVSGGAGTNTLNLDPGAGNTFAYSGVVSNFSTVEQKTGQTTLTGSNTFSGTVKVTGGTLLLNGTNRVATTNALNLNGGTLEVGNGGANGQTFSSLTLTDNSALDLDGDSSVTFNGFTSATSGKTLSIIDYSAAVSPDYAVRFSGNLTGNSGFMTFVNSTNIGGQPAGISFDGAYTNLVPVPEPSTVLAATLLLGFVGWRERRRLRP